MPYSRKNKKNILMIKNDDMSYEASTVEEDLVSETDPSETPDSKPNEKT